MGGFARAPEDRPTPPEVYNWRVYMAALVISMGVLAYGYDSAFIGGLLTYESFKRDFGITPANKNEITSNITSIYSAGGLIGALFMYPILEVLGRRTTVIISDAIFIFGAILCTVPKNQLSLVLAGRFFTGMGVGGIAAVSPIYIAEISPPAIRGRLTGFFESFYQTGAVIGFWINYGIVHNMDRSKSTAWRIPMAVQLIPAGLLALMIPLLKESPTWLLKRGREAEALKAYSFFRNLPEDHQYIAEEVQFVKNDIAKERAALLVGEKHATFLTTVKAAAKEGALPGMRNRFLLVFLMFMWQAWSGAAAINYYSPTIFTSIGLSDVTLWTGVYGLIKAGGSIIFFTWFIDMFGRKWPWIISSLVCAFCQYYLAIYIALGKPKAGQPMSDSTVAGGKAATASIMIFGAAWSFGANGLPWIISSEIFPASLRSISGPWAAASVWIWTLIVTKSLPQMYTSMGWGVYVFFATMLICASIYAFLFIHDTKGLRMDQMDHLFGFEGQRAEFIAQAHANADAKAVDDESEHHEKVGSAKVDRTDKLV
ncbi:general substrate transporter [Cucurbitaria berberidis CBS 394.84]|uniref:General substrate transporter n=1 Tax=Cucurbitaria berberidis CBS 394.84 TaxID=1168544 RepID=A0A9P4L958_9PLEO|nr:general substrate transporter [Cucurbitaria berberidis CBS 394.84]KAF1846053.1 general substrate transporter [Cucurbitaria berberidis CBS 394.84]